MGRRAENGQVEDGEFDTAAGLRRKRGQEPDHNLASRPCDGMMKPTVLLAALEKGKAYAGARPGHEEYKSRRDPVLIVRFRMFFPESQCRAFRIML
jgi:hypothetical protein